MEAVRLEELVAVPAVGVGEEHDRGGCGSFSRACPGTDAAHKDVLRHRDGKHRGLHTVPSVVTSPYRGGPPGCRPPNDERREG